MYFRSWLLGLVCRFGFSGLQRRILRTLRPRFSGVAMTSLFRRGHVATGRGSRNRAERSRWRKRVQALRFSPHIATLEPRMMMATSQGTGVSDTYTFVASGLADTIFIEESSTTPGSGWIHGTSGNVAIDETCLLYTSPSPRDS